MKKQSRKLKFRPITTTSLSKLEDEVTRFWKKNKTFEKSVEERPENKQYSFLDGPPFVTGMPHYGHLTGRIAKDLIPRYQTMKGKRVRRVWGWDCHGLPIEEKTEKKIGLKNRRDIEKFGINKFLRECKKYVEETSSAWEWYVDKIGEWIDLKNAYRTMDKDYMESVIWTFKQLYDKGLIYEGVKTLLYCTRCGTPVSNFEIAMDDSYADMEDPAVTVEFPLKYHKSGKGFGIVIENEKGEILIAQRNEKGREKNIGIVGGKCEKGDKTLEDTVQRECLEEIGVVPEKIKLVGSSIDIFEGRLFHTFHFKGTLKSDTKLKPHNSLKELTWIKKDKIPWEKLHIPTRNALEDVLTKREFPKIKQENPEVRVLAWTTTPWTLPSNRALVVDPEKTYIMAKVQKSDIELEKGWLVKELPKDLKEHKSEGITQAYLDPRHIDVGDIRECRLQSTGKVKDIRIRKVGNKHILTIKYFAGSEQETGQLTEKTEQLSKEEYAKLAKKATKKTTKTRYYYPLDDALTAEIDVYEKNLKGFNVVEVEFSSIKQAKKFKEPKWFGKEVTDSKGIYPPIIADLSIEEVNKINDEYEQPPHNYEEAVQTKLVIVAKKRAKHVFKNMDYEIVDEFKGKELVGLSYKAPYDFFPPNEKDFKIYEYEGMVNMEEGTGIVHSAPGFGDIDTEMGQHYGLTIMTSVDDEGKFIKEVKPWAGVYVKEADQGIINDLDKRGLLFRLEKIVHRYPYCYRCQTPLIHRAQKGWFINIQKIKKDLLKNAQSINWVPKKLQKRFDNNIKAAPDWNISRTRYWATVIPLWQCDKCNEYEVFGSIKEIEERSGQEVKGLHRDGVDHITFDCKKCKGVMKRIPEVIDVWVESGSMPAGQIHYPFENKELFKKTFPADYIVEYVGQIRAWFYCMHVMSNALFGKNSFKNVVVTGVLAGSDGRKMSKLFGNYPDPEDTLKKYGGDALRLYLMSSPIMVGEDTNISEDEIRNQVRNILFLILNSYKFFAIYANIHNFDPKRAKRSKEQILDKWIKIRTQELINGIDKHLSEYYIPDAVRLIEPFIEDLSTWYIRRSRGRFNAGTKEALKTLHDVLVDFSKAIAPIAPFISEIVYKGLKRDKIEEESVHLCKYPKVRKIKKAEVAFLEKMELVRKICSLGQAARVESGIKVRQPLAELKVRSNKLDGWMKLLVMDELNVKKVKEAKVKPGAKKWNIQKAEGIWAALDTEITEDLKEEGVARELVRTVQSMRKKQGFELGEKVILTLEPETEFVEKVIENWRDYLKKNTNSEVIIDKLEDLEAANVNGEKVKLNVAGK